MILSDMLVVELASVLAGPSLGMFLAEQGANVIKIENPRIGGDVTRSWRLSTESQEDDRSAYFCAVNWGKKSLALDLKNEDDLEKVKVLISKADILISSFRPGQALQYGLDADELLAKHPSLIVASISGYGPDDSRPAFDAIIQAETGFTYLNGPADVGRTKMPVALMDILAAHQLKQAVLLALLRRAKTDKGGHVQVDLLRAGLSSLANQATNYLVAGVAPEPIGSAHPNIAPYGEVFDTSTGPVVLAVGNDRQFKALCNVLDWDAPAIYASNKDRVRQRSSLNESLKRHMRNWNRDILLQALAEAGVPAGPINTIPEALNLPQAQTVRLHDGGLSGLRSFIAQMGTPGADLEAPPHLNEHESHIHQAFFTG
ncbi:MAG: CaiB/BaiF CoA transferase family protein [Bacteroidia bacterium]